MNNIIAGLLLELEHISESELEDDICDFTDKTIPVEIAAILNAEYDDFLIKADEIMIWLGLGEESLDDYFCSDKIAYYWLCVRNHHGVSFTDDHWKESVGRTLAKMLNILAGSYKALEPYVGDDGMVYVCGYEYYVK